MRFYFVLRILKYKILVLLSITFISVTVAKGFLKFLFVDYTLTLPRNVTNIKREVDDSTFSIPLGIDNRSTFVPGSFLVNTLPQTQSFCHFNYNFQEVLNVSNLFMAPSPEMGDGGGYKVIYDFVEGYDSGDGAGITYCTHATPEFLYYVAEIANRWDGPVSVSVFAPDIDFVLSYIVLHHLCHCLSNFSHVSVHIIIPSDHRPVFPQTSMNFTDMHEQLGFVNCSAPMNLLTGKLETFRHRNRLTYPVNVARNAARVGAKTQYVLVSDVELLPSSKLVPAFLSMLHRFKRRFFSVNQSLANADAKLSKYVFVLPVFEVESSVTNVPGSKADLLSLYSQNQAVYFHRWVCLHCQRFPGLHRWLQRKPLRGAATYIQPMLVVRREYPYHRWEPIYIGTNNEPLYNELLTWEGQQDKMAQMAEMCLMSYRFVILDGAFLVHTPGVKHRTDIKSGKKVSWRRRYQRQNIRQYESIARRLLAKYGENKKCKL